jgi:CheY-like chemotaxis protein
VSSWSSTTSPRSSSCWRTCWALDGHRVDTAPNGTTALEKLRQRRYDVVLTDIRMPALDGPGLWREVERTHPDLARRFVFGTGDMLSPETRAFLEESGLPRVSKPFDPAEVRAAVRRVLERGGK